MGTGRTSSRHRTLTVAAVTLGAGAVVHAAPAIFTVGPIRARLAPRLAGVGRADHIALTFDDGPDPLSTPLIVEELDHLGWKATFFLLGSMVRSAPGLAADLVAAGHEVAVHGDLHRSHLRRVLPDVVEDVQRATDTIASATGVQPRWFRPPYGTLSAPALVAARHAGLRTVLWTAWGRDWRAEATARSITDDVMGAIAPGGTILLHDSDCTSAPGSWKNTLAALPRLAEALVPLAVEIGPLRDHGIPA